MAFPESFLQDLKMRNDITDVVSGLCQSQKTGKKYGRSLSVPRRKNSLF